MHGAGAWTRNWSDWSTVYSKTLRGRVSSQHQRSTSQGPTVRPSVSPRPYVAIELSKQGQASMDQNYISIPYYVWVGLGIIAGGFKRVTFVT